MRYTIENDSFAAEIDDLGAELRALRSKADGHDYLWSGDPTVWKGTAPVLFPIVGRLNGGFYRYGGKEYRMPIHGFAGASTFRAEREGESAISFLLESSDETRACYPFEFRLRVRFSLEGNRLIASHTVENPAQETLWFSLGAHPGFACDMGDVLRFETTERVSSYRLDGDVLGGQEPFLQGEDTYVIREDSFVRDAYMLEGLASKYVTLERQAVPHNVRVHFSAPFLGIWAKPGAPYVCIESWYGIDESGTHNHKFEEKQGIQSLPAGGTFRLAYEAELF